MKVRMRENTDQSNSKYGHFLSRVNQSGKSVQINEKAPKLHHYYQYIYHQI